MTFVYSELKYLLNQKGLFAFLHERFVEIKTYKKRYKMRIILKNYLFVRERNVGQELD